MSTGLTFHCLNNKESNEFMSQDNNRQRMTRMLHTCFTKRTRLPESFDYLCYLYSPLDKKIVAFCFLHQFTIRGDYTYLHIFSVCIHSSFRGKKFCQLLFKHLTELWGDKYDMRLEVRVGSYLGLGEEFNTAAYRCYVRYGFLLEKTDHYKLYDEDNSRGEYEMVGVMMRPRGGIYEDINRFMDPDGSSLLSHHYIALSSDHRSFLKYDVDKRNYILKQL